MPAKDLLEHIIEVRKGEMDRREEEIESFEYRISEEQDKIQRDETEVRELEDLLIKIRSND